MDKKALRKELETALVKSIEETLLKRNPLAGQKIKKEISKVSKKVAKKFFKAIKELNHVKLPSVKPAKKGSSKKSSPVKRKPAAASKKKK